MGEREGEKERREMKYHNKRDMQVSNGYLRKDFRFSTS